MLSTALSRPRVQRRTLDFLLRPSCAKLFSSPAGNPNQELIQLLARYKKEEEALETRNPYKIRAFERAIKVIGDMEKPVRSGSQVRRLGGVGERIAKRIDAFLANVPYEASTKSVSSDVSKVADGSDDIRKTHIMQSLQTVSGIGRTKARTLYDAGCTSIAELSKPEFSGLLSPSQRICTQFAAHRDPSVSLADAEAIKEFVSENISGKYEVFLVGDHRRNNPRSPTLSLAIIHPFEIKVIPPHAPYDRETKPRPPNVSRIYYIHNAFGSSAPAVSNAPLSVDVISPLESRGMVAATLAANLQRWKGIIRIPQRTKKGDWEDRTERLRQIEEKEGHYGELQIFFVPKKCQGAALLALTGDLEFVKDICDRAHRLALHFNEYGLWKWCDEEQWEFMHGDNEEEIFRELGMEYIFPDRRNFGFLSTTTSKRGRPRKEMVEMQCKPTISNRGRPRKISETEKIKGMRGRPRKTTEETEKVKRPRGRPRKVLLQE